MSNPASRKSSGKGPKYVPPSQRGKKQFDYKKWGERFTKAGAAIKPLAFSHPVVLGLTVMTVTTAAHIILDAVAGPPPFTSSGRSDTRTRHGLIDDRIQGLFLGADGIAKASALAPIVAAGAGLVGDILSTRKTSD